MTNNERFNALLNGCEHPRAVYVALLALGCTGPLDKENAPISATNTDEGEVEQTLTGTDSTSIIIENGGFVK